MDSNGFFVRRATVEDTQGVLDITREAFVKYAEMAGLKTVDALSETFEQVKRDIESKYVYAAFLDNKIVGSVRLDVNKEAKTAYLSRFGVSVVHQNLGIGKSLMNLVDTEMQSLGVKKVYLHTAAKVKPLIIFYYGRNFYVESTSNDRGYIRALLVKEY
ncbi:MAG: Acetyltransferase (GNAT) family protein [Firmicutes bacterium ADurb.Bin193]|nr:MAG: Acetyltransferase (GNAT) family protein [Firmicutes bacterium ADurb.Bin193]